MNLVVDRVQLLENLHAELPSLFEQVRAAVNASTTDERAIEIDAAGMRLRRFTREMAEVAKGIRAEDCADED